MAFTKNSKPKAAERVVRKRQADGTIKEYRYPAFRPRRRDTADTLESLIDAYRDSPEWAALAEATRQNLRTYLKPLAHVGHLSLSAVNRRTLIGIHDKMKMTHGNGASTGFLTAAAAVFRWAVRKEWMDTSPASGIQPATGGHLRAWTVAEADAAERGLPEAYRRVVVLARHTGQRRGDLCALRWSDYDGRSIRLTQQKSKPGATPVRLVIPVAPALRTELDAWRATATAATILTNSRGRPWIPVSLSQLLPGAMKRIGLSPDLNVHGLRKLAATELANAGCSAHEIAAITGHTTLAMVQLYTRSADQERLALAAAARLQTSYNSQQPPENPA